MKSFVVAMGVILGCWILSLAVLAHHREQVSKQKPPIYRDTDKCPRPDFQPPMKQIIVWV